MSIATYAELKTSVARWLNRLESDTDMVPFIPDFITLAETEMRADLDPRVLVLRTPLATFGTVETLPVDYQSVMDVYLHADDGERQRQLRYATDKEFSRMKTDRGTGGEPGFYTIVGGNIEFYTPGDPTDAEPWKYTMTYQSQPSLGPTDADTNLLLTTWPGVYLYGTLIHSAPFLEEDQRIQTWGSMYNELVKKINDDAVYSEAGTAQISMPELF